MNVGQGKRVSLTWDGNSKLIDATIELVRNERARSGHSPIHTLVIAPVSSVGAQGQASRPVAVANANALTTTGNPMCTLTIGAEGITQATQFAYPVNGATLAIAAQDVQLQVRATDWVTAITAANRPTVGAWLIEGAVPTEPQPLVTFAGGFVSGTTNWLGQFARAILVSSHGAGWASSLVEFQDIAGATICTVRTADRFARVAVPAQAMRVRITTDNATAYALFEELAFT